MSEERPAPCPFYVELASIVASARGSSDSPSREDVFEALARLERRALIAGAPDPTLRGIAEARFLVGILRDAVRPLRPGALRAVLRARGASGTRLDRA